MLRAWAWAAVPGRGRVWVVAIRFRGSKLYLAASAAELRGQGLLLPLTGEVVSAEGARTVATVRAQGRRCLLAWAGSPAAARFEVTTGRP